MHPLAPVGTLFAVTVWPLLAAFLLLMTPPGRQAVSSRTFAIAGALMTPVAVWLMPGADALAAACSCVVAVMPLLLPPAGDRVGRILPFLVTGCALMALNVHSAFAVTVLCGAGTVLWAWREGRGAQKAAIVWDMARSRLGGVILGVLGASLLSMEQSPLGPVLLTVGLCMMAGLGPSPVPEPDAVLLDTGLRFAAILLMLRLDGHPLVHILVLVAGFGTLIMRMAGQSRGRGVFLPILSSLGAIAAAVGEGSAIVLLLVASVGLAVLERQNDGSRYEMVAAGVAPWPVFCALLAIGRSLEPLLLVLMIVCLLPGLRQVRLAGLMPSGLSLKGGIVPAVEVVLLLVGLCGPLLLAWHPAPGWRP